MKDKNILSIVVLVFGLLIITTVIVTAKIDLTGTAAGGESYVIWLYDAAGGTTVSSITSDITFDNEGRKDSDYYTHGADSAEVTIVQAGDYLISYDMSAKVSDGTRSNVDWEMQVNTGGGFADIPGTWAGTYHRTSADDENTGGCTCVYSASAGDIVKVIGTSDRATQVTTVAHGCRLYIEKL